MIRLWVALLAILFHPGGSPTATQTHTPHSKASAQLIMTILLMSNGEYTKRILHTRETPDDKTFLSSPFIQVGLCNRHDDDQFHSGFVRLFDVSGLINSNSNSSSSTIRKLMLLLLFSLLNTTKVALIRHRPTGSARKKRRKKKHNKSIASHRNASHRIASEESIKR